MVKDRKDKLKKEKPDKKETEMVKEIELSVESDAFNDTEREDIIKIVEEDVKYGQRIQGDYVKQKELDLKHYHMTKPSEIENLDKRPWQSDRNLGLARAIADSFQSVYMATCWTPDTINFIATTSLDIDMRNEQATFTKWGMGKHE